MSKAPWDAPPDLSPLLLEKVRCDERPIAHGHHRQPGIQSCERVGRLVDERHRACQQDLPVAVALLAVAFWERMTRRDEVSFANGARARMEPPPAQSRR